MRDFDVLVINLEGSDERLESVRHMLDREHVEWRRMPAVDGRHGMPEGDYDYDEMAAQKCAVFGLNLRISAGTNLYDI